MISNKETFNINKVAIPFTKGDLEKVIATTVKNGYIATTYDNLIDTLETVSRANEYVVTLNPSTIYLSANNPLEKNDVLIRVEGTQTYSEFINNVIHNTEDYTWTNFLTYSELFKDEIRNVKCLAYKKFLWNYHNIDNWFSENNIGLVSDNKSMLINDFEYFKTHVLETGDFESFIDCCKDKDIDLAISFVIRAGVQVLKKYKVELNRHISNDNKRQEQIVLKNPIINKIFMQPSAAAKCRKDWPKIKFTVLDKKSFDSISVWEN